MLGSDQVKHGDRMSVWPQLLISGGVAIAVVLGVIVFKSASKSSNAAVKANGSSATQNSPAPSAKNAATQSLDVAMTAAQIYYIQNNSTIKGWLNSNDGMNTLGTGQTYTNNKPIKNLSGHVVSVYLPPSLHGQVGFMVALWLDGTCYAVAINTSSLDHSGLPAGTSYGVYKSSTSIPCKASVARKEVTHWSLTGFPG